MNPPVLGTVIELNPDGTGTVQLGKFVRALFFVNDGRQVRKNGRLPHFSHSISRPPVEGEQLVCFRTQAAVESWAHAEDYKALGGIPHDPADDPPSPPIRRREESNWW